MKRHARLLALPALLAFLHAVPAGAQTAPVASGSPAAAAEPGAEDLAKKLANPVSDLVSVPFQANWDQGVGVDDGTRFILNIQPVVPVSLTKKWNLIGRVIMPIIGMPPLVTGAESTSGMGDILASAFFSPADSSKVIWGVGPVVSLPTTTDPYLGSGKWSGGPTFVILKQKGPWTYGVLWNQIWSFADAIDADRPEVSQMFVQPFMAHTNKRAVTYQLSSESTANWKADDGDQWTVPIIAMVSKVSSFGPFIASYGAGVGGYVVSPEGGPDWKLRAMFTLLLPKKKA
jgi:hypothetical protein